MVLHFDPSPPHLNGLHADESTQQQVILQARAAAPLMRMEGVFWQGKPPDTSNHSLQHFRKEPLFLSVLAGLPSEVFFTF